MSLTDNITPQDAKNLLILLGRVPNLGMQEVDEFVALRSKLGKLAAQAEPAEPDGTMNPLAPPDNSPVVVGPAPPRRARARKSTKRTR